MGAVVFPVNAVAGAPSYTGRMLRQSSVSPLAAMGSTARPLGARSGVRPGTPTNICSVTATTWTVTPFAGLIDGAVAAIAGAYGYAFDSNQTGAVAAAGGSARTDRLDVQVIDPAEGGVAGANPLIQVVYTAGTPGLAAAPPQSHPLARLNVPASGGGSPTVTWVASYSAAAGAIIPFPTKALMDAVVLPVGTYADVFADSTTVNNALYRSTGTVWVRVSPMSWRNRKGVGTNPPASTMTSVLTVVLPADAPAGQYKVRALPFTWSGAATTHFRQVKWGATTLDGGTTGMSVPAGADFCYPGEWLVTHTGGAVTVDLSVQVNGGTPSCNAESLLIVDYIGPN